MADTIDLDDRNRDDRIYQLRMVGISPRKIADQYGTSVGDVNAIVDKRMPKLDNTARARMAALDLELLGELQARFARDALGGDQGAGHLVLKIAERKAAMLGTEAPIKMDPVRLIEAAGPQQTSIDRIEHAIQLMRSRGKPQSPDDDATADDAQETPAQPH